MNSEELLNIGAFAVATGLSIPALRPYDEIGLLKPARVDPDTGYRRYGRDQLDQARLICGLRGMDLPIDENRAVLAGGPAKVPGSRRSPRAVGGSGARAVAAGGRRGRVHREGHTHVSVAGSPAGAAADQDQGHPGKRRPSTPRRSMSSFNEYISSLQFGAYRTDRFFLLNLEDQESAAAGGAHFGLLVHDVDNTHDRALSAGAAEVHPPMDFDWKPRTSCVRDPSGNLIDLTQS